MTELKIKKLPFSKGNFFLKAMLALQFIIFLCNPILATPFKTPNSGYDLYKLNLIAEKAFAENNHDEAIQILQIIEKHINRFPKAKKWINQYLYAIPQLSIVKKHKKMGQIAPKTVLKIVVYYIKRTAIQMKNKHGKKTLVKNSIKPKQLATAKIAQEIFKKYIEVITAGEVSIQFKRKSINCTLRNILVRKSWNDYQNKSFIRRKPDFNSLDPFPRKIFYKDMKQYDMAIFFWNGKGISGRPTGWVNRLPLVPYQLFTTKRGLMQFPLVYKQAGTILHEFFHYLEDIYKISPRHGFLKKYRHNFKGWKGKGQFPYFRWHFNQTIKKQGYQYMEIKAYWPSRITDKILEKNLKISATIKKGNKKRAYQFYLDTEIKQGFKKIKLLEQTVRLNKYFSPALSQLSLHEYYQKNRTRSRKLGLAAYKINPTDHITCYSLALNMRHLKQYKKAHFYFNETIKLAPTFYRAYYQRGFLYFIQGKVSKAIRDLKQVIILNPKFKQKVLSFYSRLAKQGFKNAKKIISGLR